MSGISSISIIDHQLIIALSFWNPLYYIRKKKAATMIRNQVLSAPLIEKFQSRFLVRRRVKVSLQCCGWQIRGGKASYTTGTESSIR